MDPSFVYATYISLTIVIPDFLLFPKEKMEITTPIILRLIVFYKRKLTCSVILSTFWKKRWHFACSGKKQDFLLKSPRVFQDVFAIHASSKNQPKIQSISTAPFTSSRKQHPFSFLRPNKCWHFCQGSDVTIKSLTINTLSTSTIVEPLFRFFIFYLSRNSPTFPVIHLFLPDFFPGPKSQT